MDLYDRIIRELRMILESLCGRELNEQGRQYIMNRIKFYENKRDEVRLS
jgi:hypothetical protein